MESEDELIHEAEVLEQETRQGETKEVKEKAKALATRVLHHLEQQRDNPVAQRAALVRLAQARPLSRLLAESGLIAINKDEHLGRTVIKLRADDELVDRMRRANSAEILNSPDAPLIRIFKQN